MHDVLIIGGGAIGLSIAYELAGRGASVRLIERGEIGREASWAGAGILPPAVFRTHDPPLERLAGLSFDLHPRWAAELREATAIDNGFRRSGGVYLNTDREAAEWIARGVRFESLDANRLAEREPAIARSEANFLPAWFVPDECQIRNPRHLRALAVAAAARGVEISPCVEMLDVRLKSNRVDVVETSAGTIRAGAYCFAAGAWTSLLSSRFANLVAVRPVRGQIVLLQCRKPTVRHIVHQGPRYLVPRPDGRLLIGSTEDEAGFDRRATPLGIAGLLQFAIDVASELADAEIERAWGGLRPAAADGLPLLGRLANIENAYAAAGHFREGLLLSPGTAVVMSQLLLGQETTVDITPFDPSRRATNKS